MSQSTAPKSEMQKDVDHWVQKASYAAKNSQTITAPAGETEWTHGLFECFNPIDTCLITCCCPCITFGKTHHRLHKDPQLRDYSVVNASCLGFWASGCFGLHWVGNLLQKSDIAHRSQPKLKTNIVTDCLKAWCCNCCDLIQQDKEAEALLAKEQSTVLQQPTKTEGMAYQQQQF